MTRNECIDLLLSYGTKDLTSEKHPNKKGKLYLRLFLKGKNSSVDFNFDYYEYKQVSVFANRRKDIRKQMFFSEIKNLLVELGFMKIYIAGQITGLPIEKARENFSPPRLKRNLKAYETVNPDGTRTIPPRQRVDRLHD